MARPDLVHDASGALRVPWRLAVFLVVALIAAVTLGTVLPAVGIPDAATGMAAAMLLAHWATFRLVGRGDWSTVGLGPDAARGRAIPGGMAIGALAIGVPTLGLIMAGWFSVEPAEPGSSTLAALRLALLLLPAALWEELFFRGYLFATIREALGAPIALALTSLAFGLLHLGNAGANLQAIAQVTMAGVWLGVVLLATRSLYAAWAAHFAWNWTLAAVLHAPVSGIPFPVPDYRLVDTGPGWATGGIWGPEAGLFALVGMVSTMIFLFARQRRRRES